MGEPSPYAREARDVRGTDAGSIDAMPEVRTVRCRAIVPRFCDQKRVGMGRVWLISNALWALCGRAIVPLCLAPASRPRYIII